MQKEQDQNWIDPKLAGLQIAGIIHFRSLDFFICLPPKYLLFDGGYVYCFPQMFQVKRLFRGYIYSAVYRVWQYQLWSFQERDTKLERFLVQNQHTQRKF